ncbi:MAG: hypothetical protein PVH61_41545 [Candidatus Aminicenantes bacterium]
MGSVKFCARGSWCVPKNIESIGPGEILTVSQYSRQKKKISQRMVIAQEENKSPDPVLSMGFPTVTGKTEKIEVLKLLAYYLATCDDFYDHVVSMLNNTWKTLIDNQILDVNAK